MRVSFCSFYRGGCKEQTFKLITAVSLLFMFSFDVCNFCAGRAIAQAVSRRLPTVAARIRAQFRSCEISGGQSGVEAGFLRVLRFPLPIFIPPTAPQSPSPIIWGWYNRPIVTAVLSGLGLTSIRIIIKNLCVTELHKMYYAVVLVSTVVSHARNTKLLLNFFFLDFVPIAPPPPVRGGRWVRTIDIMIRTL
jgi:hypothetical protein